MKIYWLKQISIVMLLFILAFTIDIYMSKPLILINIAILKQTILIIIVTLILIACNQLLYNFSKINSEFMQHKIWRKMPVIIFIWIFLSFTIFVALFTMTPFSDILQKQIWVLYIIIYYFLFFINLLVLSIININTVRTTEKKLILACFISALLIALVIFCIPTF